MRQPRQLLLLLIPVVLFLFFYILTERKGPPVSVESAGPAHVSARIGPPDIYPDPNRTPGAANPQITQANIEETICNREWSTKSIRPPVSYTNKLKIEQIREYGFADTDPKDYEEDHLIPLEIGGDPRDPKNLWPEAYQSSIESGARSKDQVENYLHEEVCSHKLTLAEAQREIATDWYGVYVNSMKARH